MALSEVIIKADILAIASQLSTLNDAAWVTILAFVNAFEGIDCDPSLRKLALCLLGAHLGTMAGTTGASGATTSVIAESAGGLKRTYAQPGSTSTENAGLDRTDYGKQFLAIMKMSISSRGPFLV
jgi:hypothetical protein